MAREQSVESPCVKICQLDQRRGYCVGCYRTGAEIAAWVTADDDTRRDILVRARERQRAARPAAQGSTRT
jgi:predicted Fe-S protein YdhL (DUF1289 family)